jgi:hypothetical protein
MNYDEKPLLLKLPETCSEVVSLNQLVHLGLLFDSTGKIILVWQCCSCQQSGRREQEIQILHGFGKRDGLNCPKSTWDF